MDSRYITNYFRDLERSRTKHLEEVEEFEQRIQERRREMRMLRTVYERAASLRALLIGLMLGFLTSSIIATVLDELFGPNSLLSLTFWLCLVVTGVFAVILLFWQRHIVKMRLWLENAQLELHLLANRRDDARYGADGEGNELAEMRQAFPWLVEV